MTTRFPRDSAARYAAEPDFADWSRPAGDLRPGPAPHAERGGVLRELLATRERLDFIINNACQTVRRPPAFYAHMMDGERARRDDLAPEVRKLLGAMRACAATTWSAHIVHGGRRARRRSAGDAPLGAADEVAGPLTRARAELSQMPLLADELLGQQHLFPEGRLDQDLQQVDLRGRNSWRLQMARSAVGGTARGPAGQRGRAVHDQRAAEAADAAHARPRQAHRQRVGGGGPVLPQLQDHASTRTPTWPRPR